MPRTHNPEGEKEFNIRLGQRMRRYRKLRGYTIEKLAEVTYCSYSAYIAYESGKTAAPAYVLSLLCIFLKIPANDLLDVPDNSWQF